MKFLTEKEILKEIDESAEIFIRSVSDECDNSVFETYRFTFEELRVFLVLFANGVIQDLNEHNKAFKWSADWLMNHATANGNPEIVEFASNVSMTLKSQIRS